MLRTKARDTSGQAEVFLEYHALLSVDDGPVYRARACGGEARDGTNRWHGWIEFLPQGVPQGEGSLVLHTARETTQPDRTCTVYWSTGLTQVYLEGALERARGLVRIRSATDAHVSRTAPADLPTAILRGRAT
jgi:hypothetical protein